MGAALAVTTRSADARRDKRLRLRMPVVVLRGIERLAMHTGDVSVRGLFLRTETPLPSKDIVRIEIILPISGTKLALRAAVVHSIVAGGAHPSGSGLELYGNGEVERAVWEDFIREAERCYPQALEKEVFLVPTVRIGATAGHTCPTLCANASPSPAPRALPPAAARAHAACRFEAVLSLKAYFDDVQALGAVYSSEMARGTMSVTSPVILDVGAKLSLCLVHPSTRDTFVIHAQVCSHAHGQASRTMSIEFLDLNDTRRAQLEGFIRDGVSTASTR